LTVFQRTEEARCVDVLNCASPYRYAAGCLFARLWLFCLPRLIAHLFFAKAFATTTVWPDIMPFLRQPPWSTLRRLREVHIRLHRARALAGFQRAVFDIPQKGWVESNLWALRPPPRPLRIVPFLFLCGEQISSNPGLNRPSAARARFTLTTQLHSAAPRALPVPFAPSRPGSVLFRTGSISFHRLAKMLGLCSFVIMNFGSYEPNHSCEFTRAKFLGVTVILLNLTAFLTAPVGPSCSRKGRKSATFQQNISKQAKDGSPVGPRPDFKTGRSAAFFDRNVVLSPWRIAPRKQGARTFLSSFQPPRLRETPCNHDRPSASNKAVKHNRPAGSARSSSPGKCAPRRPPITENFSKRPVTETFCVQYGNPEVQERLGG